MDDEYSEPPNDAAIQMAHVAREALRRVGIEPEFYPSGDAGMTCSIRRGQLYADIECFNSGEVLAVTSAGYENGSTDVWDVREDGVEAAAMRIAEFFTEPAESHQ